MSDTPFDFEIDNVDLEFTEPPAASQPKASNRRREPALVEIRMSDVAGYAGYDYEHDEPTGEITIADLVVKGLVDRLAKDLQAQIEKLVREQVAEQVRTQVGEWVDAALARPIQKTNTWGQPEGPALSIPQLVQTQVEDWLTKPVKNGAGYISHDSPNRVKAMIAEEVDRKLKSEMADAIRTAKNQVIQAVQTRGGELLGEAIRTANLLDGVR